MNLSESRLSAGKYYVTDVVTGELVGTITIDGAGAFTGWEPDIELTSKGTAILMVTPELLHAESDDDQSLIPLQVDMTQNYPNPFNPTTTIHIGLPKATKVYLVVYDVLGREVTRLKQEELGAGYHQVLWDGRDQARRDLASGIYFARLVTPEYSKTMKMLLLK